MAVKKFDMQKVIRDNMPRDAELGLDAMYVVAMMAHGASEAATARALGVGAHVVSSIVKQKGFASLLTVVRENIDAWHRAQLSSAGVMAWKKIVSFLSEDLALDHPMYKEQIKLADSISKRVLEQRVFIEEEAEEDENQVSLQLHPSSIDLIARKISDLQSTDDPAGLDVKKLKKTSLDNLPPVVQCHPSARYGNVDYGDNGWRVCHICGKEQESFYSHVEARHNMKIENYARTFGIDIEQIEKK